MNLKEVKKAIKDKSEMAWNDPDPIKGTDYTIQKIFNIDEETATIHYGRGCFLSEAEVYLNEIILK